MAALTLFSVPPRSAGDISSAGGLLFLFTCGAASAAIVLLSSIDGLASRLLHSPITTYLGRISYSLYLTHVLVILTIVHVWGGVAKLPVLVGLAIPVSIAVAHIFNRVVEAPAGRLGRWLEARMSGWRSNGPTPGN